MRADIGEQTRWRLAISAERLLRSQHAMRTVERQLEQNRLLLARTAHDASARDTSHAEAFTVTPDDVTD